MPFLRNSLRWKHGCLCQPSRQPTKKRKGTFWFTASYFFFWAFSAAFVTLPDVRSLWLTLCNRRQEEFSILQNNSCWSFRMWNIWPVQALVEPALPSRYSFFYNLDYHFASPAAFLRQCHLLSCFENWS